MNYSKLKLLYSVCIHSHSKWLGVSCQEQVQPMHVIEIYLVFLFWTIVTKLYNCFGVITTIEVLVESNTAVGLRDFDDQTVAPRQLKWQFCFISAGFLFGDN